MKMLLFKGRKAFPIGHKTRDKSGNWWIKTAQGWKYYGGGEKAGEKKYTRKRNPTPTRNKDIKQKIEWIVGKVPSREYIEQEIMKRTKKELPTGFQASVKTQMDKLGLHTLKDLSSVAQGQHKDWKNLAPKVHDVIGRNAVGAMGPAFPDSAMWYAISRFYRDINKATYLSDPKFDGNLRVSYLTATKDGLDVTFSSNVGVLPHLIVPYGQLEEFGSVWKIDKRKITKLKKFNDYKQWQVTGDPAIAMEIKEFKKASGLEIAANAVSGGRVTQLKKEYIKRLTNAFKSLKTVLDFKKYTPPDGEAMNVRVSGAGRRFVGTYTEWDHTINISPSKPGVITHEIGHYFWHRHPQMHQEFSDWVKNSGLFERIQRTLAKKEPDKAMMNSHIDKVFGLSMKYTLRRPDTSTPVKDAMRDTNIPASVVKDGLALISNVYRLRLKDNAGNIPKELRQRWKPVSFLLNVADGDIESLALSTKQQYPDAFSGHTDNEMLTSLKGLKEVLKKMDSSSRSQVFDKEFSDMLRDATRSKFTEILNRDVAFYQKESGYWSANTEIFARTFRNYLAMKDNQPEFKSSTEQNRYFVKKGKDASAKNLHGWDFPELSPDYGMIRDRNNEFEKLLKKHLGEKVVKSIMLAMKVLMKANDDDDDDEDDRTDTEKEYDREVAAEEAKENKPKKFRARMQKAAHKLQKRYKFHGLDISIENRKGSVRRWYDPMKDESGETKMKYDYGYIRATKGNDGDSIDCYVGPNKNSMKVFVVHQNDPKTGKYDEDKCMLGFDSVEEAKKAYLMHYDDPKFFGSMEELPFDSFQEKVTKKQKGKVVKVSKVIKALLVMKAKYIKRWRGKDNKWHYEYPESHAATLKTKKGWVSKKTGHELVHYEHRTVLGEKFSEREGGMVTARVSDWENPEASELSGRTIVHVYWIKDKDTGEIKPFGIRSAESKLGVDEDFLKKKGQTILSATEEEERQEKMTVETFEKYASDSMADANDKWNSLNAEGYRKKYGHPVANTTALTKDGKFVRIPSRWESAMVKVGWTVRSCVDEGGKLVKSRMIIKAKPYPEGTVRPRKGGKKAKKVGREWLPVTEGKTKEETEKDSKKKGKKKNKPVQGTKEMFNGLREINGSTGVFMDDVRGDRRKAFNSLTKMGLISWKHIGQNEYKATLTDAGQKALDGAEGAKRKSVRGRKVR